MDLVDTHCHIHFPDYQLEPSEVIKSASKTGVKKLLCVGCTLLDSKLAIEMASENKNIWATIGLHPHEAKEYINDGNALQEFHQLVKKPKVVAIGETGLDYYYEHSSKKDQKKMFQYQLDLAVENKLPLIFHVRNPKDGSNKAFDDFFAVLDSYKGIRGVVHSYTSNTRNLDKMLAKGLYIGINGIITFSKDKELQESVRAVPLDRILLETDAPFLTPHPYRGKVCEPKYTRITAEFLAQLRGVSQEEVARTTTKNAQELFGLK